MNDNGCQMKKKRMRPEMTPDDNVSTCDTMLPIKAYEILKDYTVCLLYYGKGTNSVS